MWNRSRTHFVNPIVFVRVDSCLMGTPPYRYTIGAYPRRAPPDPNVESDISRGGLPCRPISGPVSTFYKETADSPSFFRTGRSGKAKFPVPLSRRTWNSAFIPTHHIGRRAAVPPLLGTKSSSEVPICAPPGGTSRTLARRYSENSQNWSPLG
jgi:hypothetical protein